MRFLFFICIVPLCASELVLPSPPYLYNDGVNTELGHGHASMCVVTPSGVSTNLGWAFDTDAQWQGSQTLRYRTGISSGSATGTLCLPIKGLAASTLYRVCPVLADGLGNSTDCSSSGTDPNRFFTFTTQAAPPVDPAPPIRADVSDFDTSYPDGVPAIGTAGDFAVASNCSNLVSQIRAAVTSADSSGVAKAVTIPSTAVCSGGNLPVLPARAPGKPWVVIRTSQESSLPSPGIRVTKAEYGQYMPVMKVTSADSGFISGDGTTNAKIRFVGIRIIFDDGSAPANAGHPTYLSAFLWRITVPTSWIVFDRSIFDGQGYPFRLNAAVYIKGAADFQYVAWVGCQFANIYNWLGWMSQMTLTGSSTNTLASTANFLVGRGNAVYTVAPWSIKWNGGANTTGKIYLTPDGVLHFVSSSATVAPTCVGVVCSADATLTIPATGFEITGPTPLTITGGVWVWPGPTVGNFWGQQGTGDGVIGDDTEKESFAITTDSLNGIAPNIGKLIIENNNVDGAGILMFFASFGVTRNIIIDKNDFTTSAGCFLAAPLSKSSTPFFCHNRYPFELKNGYAIDFTGNTIHDQYQDENNDGSWFSLKPDTTISPGSYTGDIYIANNYASNVVGCFYISGELNNGGGIWNYPKVIRRVEYSNNFCQSNPWTRTSYFGKWGHGVANFGYSAIEQGAVDINFLHNTLYDARGRGPALLAVEAASHGVSFNGNVFTYHQSPSSSFRGFQSGYIGSGRWSAATIPDMGFNLPLIEGTNGLNAAIPSLGAVAGSSWFWDNLMIPGCVDTSPAANCTDNTSGGGLVTAPTSTYPAATRWPSGSTLGGRYRTAGFIDRPGGNFRLNSSSPYQSGGASHANDRLAYGFNQSANEQLRGLITQPRVVSITSANAVIAANVPVSGAACRVAYKTSGGAPWATTAVDTSSSLQRSITVSGLTTQTVYSYQVWCAGATPTPAQIFRTQ